MWINIYTIFAQYLPKYAGKFLHILCNRVNFQRSSRCFLTNLHGWQEFYTTAGRTGRAKYQLCFMIDFLWEYQPAGQSGEVA